MATLADVLVPPDVLAAWRRAVNCTPSEIEEWHSTDASASVGSRRPGDRWSVGQLAGMRTVELLETPVEEWNAADVAHVRRVSGFVRRHRAQWPRGDLRRTRWRHSLRNWGHDPLWESRLSTGTSDAEGRRAVVVDGEGVGWLRLTDDGAGAVLEELHLAKTWRRRGLGSAVLHGLALEYDGALEVALSTDALALGEVLRRRHFDAPAPDSPVLHLTGW